MVNENLKEDPKTFNFKVQYHVGFNSLGTSSAVSLECKVGENSSSVDMYYSGMVSDYVSSKESSKILSTPLKQYANADLNVIAKSTEKVIQNIAHWYGIVYSPQDQISFPEEGKKIGSIGACDDGSKYVGYGFSLKDLVLNPNAKETIESQVKSVSEEIRKRREELEEEILSRNR